MMRIGGKSGWNGLPDKTYFNVAYNAKSTNKLPAAKQLEQNIEENA